MNTTTADINARILAFLDDPSAAWVECSTDDLVDGGWENDETWWRGQSLPVRIRAAHDGRGLEVCVQEDGIWHDAYPGAIVPVPTA